MKEKVLSIFIDESGDFGQYNPTSPNYYVAMVLHKNVLTKSESEFFHSKNDFKKNIYKNIAKKKL